MTATAAGGYVFECWKVDGVTQSNVGSSVSGGGISLTAGCTLTAVFRSTAAPTYTITYDVVGSGTVSKASGTSAEGGAIATPNEGFHFVGWRLNGEIVSSDLVFDTSLVSANCTVTAVFAEDGEESAFFQRYYYKVYRFVHWVNARGEHVTYDDRLRIKASDITGDTWFTAIFEPVTDVNIYYECDPLRGTVTPGHELASLTDGAEGSVAEPFEGYRFIIWVNENGEPVWPMEEFWPDDDMLHEGATFTAIHEPDTYTTYTWVGADTNDDDEPCGYITSQHYTNTVNDRVVAMYIREDGKLPADLKANAFEEYVFDHWELNGEVLEGVGETIPQYYDLGATGNLKWNRDDNTLIAYYKPNPNISWHTIHYAVDPEGGGRVSRTEDTWYGSRTGTIIGATATANAGYEFAGWVEKKENGVILPVAGSKTAALKPGSKDYEQWAKDATYYAVFRKITGASGMVGYNMNIRDVPVQWSGPQDFVMTSGVGAVMYYDTKNGSYYTTDEYFNLSTEVPSAEGYAFLGWFDKDRPEYANDSRKDSEGNYTYQPARLLPGGAGTRCRFVFNGSAGGRYTVEAVWAGLKADSKRLPYDGAAHYLTAECFLEEGTLPETPRYERQLTALLNQGGYTLGQPKYQLIAQDGVMLENQPVTDSFSRVQPGVYTVKVTATGAFKGSPFTIEKTITLEIYPAKVVIVKYWENDTEEIRPGDLEVNKTWLSNAPAHRFGQTAVTAGQMAGRPEDHEPEWTKHGAVWTKEYDNVLVRSEGIEETDQDSYYYEYYADEVVPAGYTQVGETTRELSDDRLTTTIAFRNAKTSIDLGKHWYDARGNEIEGKAEPVTLTLYRKDASGHVEQVGEPVQVVAGQKVTVPITNAQEGCTYFVEETGIDGYTTAYSCLQPGETQPWDDVDTGRSAAVPIGGTLIVRNIRESVAVEARKQWVKGVGASEETVYPEGASVTLKLQRQAASGGETAWVDVTDADGAALTVALPLKAPEGEETEPADLWRARWEGLDKYEADDATPIRYRVVETEARVGDRLHAPAAPAEAAFGEGDDTAAVTVTNPLTDYEAVKLWADVDDGVDRSAEIKLTRSLRYADGSTAEDEDFLLDCAAEDVAVQEDGSILYRWRDLPGGGWDPERGAFTCVYAPVETGYTWGDAEGTVTFGDGGFHDGAGRFVITREGNAITNTRNTTSITVTKAWRLNGSEVPATGLPETMSGEAITSIQFLLWQHDPTDGDAVTANAQYGEARTIEARLVDGEYMWSLTVDDLPRFVLNADGTVRRDGSGAPCLYTYYVTELTALQGYTVTVTTADGEKPVGIAGEQLTEGEVRMTNSLYTVKLPSTGGPGTGVFTAMGLGLIALALALLARRRWAGQW